jgi:hypothetical protein
MQQHFLRYQVPYSGGVFQYLAVADDDLFGFKMSRPLDVDARGDRKLAALGSQSVNLKQKSCETVHDEGHGYDNAAVR